MRFDFPIFLSITFYVRNKKIFQFHLQFNLILKLSFKRGFRLGLSPHNAGGSNSTENVSKVCVFESTDSSLP